MAIHRGKTIDRDLEKRILTAMIVSDSLLQKLRPIFQPKYFELTHCQKISVWIRDYFDTYSEAPGRHFQDIFNSYKSELTEQELEVTEDFLVELSEQYVAEAGINEDFLLDKATGYFKKQALLKNAKEVIALAEAGDIARAELIFSGFKEVSVSASEWVEPFTDRDFVQLALLGDGKSAIKLNTIGTLIGAVKPGWLLSFLGPMKRGKTWALQNIAMDLLTLGRKVAVISLEMEKLHLAPRYYMQMGGVVFTEESEKVYLKTIPLALSSYRTAVGGKWVSSPAHTEVQTLLRAPVFDCVKNRTNACRKPCRVNHEPFPGVYDDKTPTNYKACSVCREHAGCFDFEPVVWWEANYYPVLSSTLYDRLFSGFKIHYKPSNLKMISYPAYSANLRTVTQALDLLEFTEGFIPDDILIDYADILAPEDSRITGRDAIDLTWKALKNLAATRNCRVWTASQAGRRALNAKTVDTTDISEDIRKLAHVDAMIGLNQTPVERDAGIMRLTCVAHRWFPSSINKSLTVLQNLSCGQFFLDSSYGTVPFDKQTLADTANAEEFDERS